MALNFLLKRSGTASKRPAAASMSLGEVDINYNASTGGLFYKDSSGSVVKVGPAEVGSTAPNSSPAGSSGNSAGEFWYDTTNSVLKIWNGTSWVDTVSTAGFLSTSGGSMTGNLYISNSELQIEANSTFASIGTATFSGTTDLNGATSFFFTPTWLENIGPASQVTYDNTASGLTATEVQGAIDEINTLVDAKVASVSGNSPITVDNSDPLNPIIEIDLASTTAAGAVQLNDTVSSTSTTEAATANAVKSAYDLANAAIPESVFTAKGQLVAGDASSTPVAIAPGSDGMTLFACSACTGGMYWGGSSCFSATPTVAGILFGCTTSAGTNVSVGHQALNAVTSGAGNTAIGQNALCANISGNNNTVIGCGSARSMTASGLVAVGQNTLPVATAQNVAIGNCAGLAVTTATGNILIGDCAMCRSNTSNNIAIGNSTLCGLQTCSGGNVAVGHLAGCGLATGHQNVFIGNRSGLAQTSGFQNVAIGADAAYLGTGGTRNIVIGHTAGIYVAGCENVAIATCSLGSTTTGGTNIAIGRGAGFGITTGCQNVTIGWNSLCAAGTTSTGNAVLGHLAGCSLTNGCYNVVLGFSAQPASTTGSCQLAIGFSATDNWLTGTSTKAIKPGAGIIDCAGSCGTAGQVLMSTGANAICWGSPATGDITGVSAGAGLLGGGTSGDVTLCLDAACVIQPSSLAAKGDLITASGASTPVALSVGTDGQFLAADSTCTAGLKWSTITQCQGTVTSVTAGTGLTGGTISTTGTIALDSSCVIAPTLLTSTGDTVYASAANTPARLAIGSNGQYLTVQSGIPAWTNFPLTGYTGASNTGYGQGAGDSITSGVFNVTMGLNSGTALDTGSRNVAYGTGTLSTATSGFNNVAVGNSALLNLTTGGNNVAVGNSTGLSVTTATLNVYVGSQAGQGNSASQNVFVGGQAGTSLTGSTSANSVFVGYRSGTCVTTGSTNTFLGYTAGDAVTTGSNNTIIGDNPGSAALTNNLILAAGATIKLQVNENGALGVGASPAYGTSGQVLTSGGTGSAPTWTNVIASSLLTTTGDIIYASAASTPARLAIGTAGQVLTVGAGGTPEWAAAGGGGGASPATPTTAGTLKGIIYSGLGAPSTALGCNALLQSTIATTSIEDTAIGSCALYSQCAGGGNVAVGVGSLCSATFSNDNTALGNYSGSSVTTGKCNVFLGTGSGNNITTECNNVAIGYDIQTPAGLCCQLAIGATFNACWLTGNSTMAIKPGAGIIDCAGSCGTVGQVLTSTGANAIQWGSPTVGGAFGAALGTSTAIGSAICARINSGTQLPEISTGSATCVYWCATTSGLGSNPDLIVFGPHNTSAGVWEQIENSTVLDIGGRVTTATVTDQTNSAIWQITFARTTGGQAIRALRLV